MAAKFDGAGRSEQWWVERAGGRPLISDKWYGVSFGEEDAEETLPIEECHETAAEAWHSAYLSVERDSDKENVMDLQAAKWRKIYLRYPQAEMVEFHMFGDKFGIVDKARAACAELSGLFDTAIEALNDAVYRLDLVAPAVPQVGKDSEYCIPGDATPLWLVRYDDPEIPDSVFSDEDSARLHYAAASMKWNCYLFSPTRTVRKAQLSAENVAERTEPTEEERVVLYHELVSGGLSDYEARETAWPTHHPFQVSEQENSFFITHQDSAVAEVFGKSDYSRRIAYALATAVMEEEKHGA